MFTQDYFEKHFKLHNKIVLYTGRYQVGVYQRATLPYEWRPHITGPYGCGRPYIVLQCKRLENKAKWQHHSLAREGDPRGGQNLCDLYGRATVPPLRVNNFHKF